MYINAKMIPVETTPGMGKGDKWKWRKGWIQVQYIWDIVRTFVNATMYPQNNNKKEI
jgi:hypothetical protein